MDKLLSLLEHRHRLFQSVKQVVLSRPRLSWHLQSQVQLDVCGKIQYFVWHFLTRLKPQDQFLQTLDRWFHVKLQMFQCSYYQIV